MKCFSCSGQTASQCFSVKKGLKGLGDRDASTKDPQTEVYCDFCSQDVEPPPDAAVFNRLFLSEMQKIVVF